MSCYWKSYWALEEARVDAAVFFRELPSILPEATTLFIEGGSIGPEVKAVLTAHSQAGPYLPNPGAARAQRFSKSRMGYFRCEFSSSLVDELERLADTHAEPEICDHLIVYAGSEPILEYYDFPQNEIWLPLKVSEQQVRAIASALNTSYRREMAPDQNPASLLPMPMKTSFPNAQDLAVAAAEEFLEARAESSTLTIALSGGRIAKDFFSAVARQAQACGQSLAHVHFFWADERCVPPDHAESNYRSAAELLFAPLGLPPQNLHRIRGEEEPDQAAREAEAELRRFASANAAGQPVLDLVLLGMGEDGHVASLFPGEAADAMSSPAIYRAVTASKPPPRRITLGYSAIAAAREVWVLASGAGKEAALRESLSPKGKTPLARVLQGRTQTRIFTDIAC